MIRPISDRMYVFIIKKYCQTSPPDPGSYVIMGTRILALSFVFLYSNLLSDYYHIVVLCYSLLNTTLDTTLFINLTQQSSLRWGKFVVHVHCIFWNDLLVHVWIFIVYNMVYYS